MRWLHRWLQRDDWPKIRPKRGRCPWCGAKPKRFCKMSCSAIDPLDTN